MQRVRSALACMRVALSSYGKSWAEREQCVKQSVGSREAVLFDPPNNHEQRFTETQLQGVCFMGHKTEA